MDLPRWIRLGLKWVIYSSTLGFQGPKESREG